MPMLDFKCNRCGCKFEELVFTHTKDRVQCPKCSCKDLDRVYEGKCLFGFRSEGRSNTSSSCAGRSCSGCSGCSH